MGTNITAMRRTCINRLVAVHLQGEASRSPSRKFIASFSRAQLPNCLLRWAQVRFIMCFRLYIHAQVVTAYAIAFRVWVVKISDPNFCKARVPLLQVLRSYCGYLGTCHPSVQRPCNRRNKYASAKSRKQTGGHCDSSCLLRHYLTRYHTWMSHCRNNNKRTSVCDIRRIDFMRNVNIFSLRGPCSDVEASIDI